MMSFIIRLTSAWNVNFSDFSLNSLIWATFNPSNLIASSSRFTTSASEHTGLQQFQIIWVYCRFVSILPVRDPSRLAPKSKSTCSVSPSSSWAWQEPTNGKWEPLHWQLSTTSVNLCSLPVNKRMPIRHRVVLDEIISADLKDPDEKGTVIPTADQPRWNVTVNWNYGCRSWGSPSRHRTRVSNCRHHASQSAQTTL